MKFTTDDLQFQDDESADFGDAPDFEMSFDSGNDRLELVDKVNTTTSYIQRNRSGSLVNGRFGQAVADGKVLADDGSVYDTIQAAENGASSWIRIGPGRFNESVTVDTGGLSVLGAGNSTIVDGGSSGDAIQINASNVRISDFSVRTDKERGGDGVGVGSNCDAPKIHDMKVIQAGDNGISLRDSGDDAIVSNCVVEDAEEDGLETTRIRGLFVNCIVKNTRSVYGIQIDDAAVTADDNIVANCIFMNSASNGIAINDSNDCIIYGNRVHSAGGDGISLNSNDHIVVNNRVSDSAGDNINDSSSGSTVQDNLTGSAN